MLSNEVRKAFYQKYDNRKTLIHGCKKLPWLVMLTTTSALGKSSIYNRIKLNGYAFWKSLGFTQGSGEFHFSNGVYKEIREYAELHCDPTAKNTLWGKGFRSKREVIKKCLQEIGLSTKLLYHGIKREVYVAPLGREAIRFLRGEVSRPCFYDWPVNELIQMFFERWFFPRVKRVPEYKSFCRENYRIWSKSDSK